MIESNFTATIRAEVIEDDGAEQRKLFEIAGHLHNKDFSCEVPAKDFAGMSWVIEQIGPGAIIYPGQGLKDRARAAIQELSEDISTRMVYRHTGWTEIDGHWYYLHANGAIGFPTIEPEVSLDGRLAGICLPVPGTPEQQRAAVEASSRVLGVMPRRVTLPL